MQAVKAYQGYYESGNFRPNGTDTVKERGQAVLLFFDVPPAKENSEQLKAFDKFMNAVRESGEETPEFERADLSRTADI